MELGMYNSYLEIDFTKIKDACEKVQRQIGPKQQMLPVLKANAYGIGALKMAEFLVQTIGVRALAVAQVFEGAELRDAGYRSVDILVMGAPPRHVLPYAVAYDLQTPVFRLEDARLLDAEAEKQGKTAKVHVKIDTGMNRIGVRAGAALDALLAGLRTLRHLQVVGVYTHFANATVTGDPFTEEQYALFRQAVGQVRAAGFAPQYIHCRNSGATEWFREDLCTHVRPGSLYMGYHSMDDHTNALDVHESCSWRAFVTNVHELRAGESAGYGRHFMAKKDTTVATIDIGYADGFYRPMGQNGGPVLIGEHRARYLTCAMDQSIIDVTGIPCAVGDEATIFGWTSSGKACLPLDEIQDFTGQTLAMNQCAIARRVRRIYKY